MKFYKIKSEDKGEIFERVSQRNYNKWLKQHMMFVRGNKVFHMGRHAFTILKVWDEKKPKPVWKYELRFWIHGTYEGDDLPMGAKFTYKPTEEEIGNIIKKAYKKHSYDPEEMYKNMGDDWQLIPIN